MESIIQNANFANVDLSDPFFDSLKSDYVGFDVWFQKKSAENASAIVTRDQDGRLEGFLYLKTEDGPVDDVTPPLEPALRLKIGTFKINAHRTKLGERFLKKIFDYAFDQSVDEVYVTIFAKHAGLVRLFEAHGFVDVARKAVASGVEELVLRRDLHHFSGDIINDYPFLHRNNVRKFLLAVYPQWHTQLLPDSKLYNENYSVIQDLSHTNSIHKVYVCKMNIDELRRGDILVTYRTGDGLGAAEYRAVATSLCVVEETRKANSFLSADEFIKYCGPYSVFSESDLRNYYSQATTRVLKFTYNAALPTRLIRGRLADEVGLVRETKWDFLPLSDEQFQKIVDLGHVNEDLIID